VQNGRRLENCLTFGVSFERDVHYTYGNRLQWTNTHVEDLDKDLKEFCHNRLQAMVSWLKEQYPNVHLPSEIKTMQFRFYPDGRNSIPPHSDLETNLYEKDPNDIWVASESYGAGRRMHWWVLDEAATPNSKGVRLHKGKHFIKIGQEPLLDNGCVMFCPPGLMCNSLHAVEQDGKQLQGRVVITYRPGFNKTIPAPQSTDSDLTRQEFWELDTAKQCGYHVRLVRAKSSLLGERKVCYKVRQLSGQTPTFGDILDKNGESLLGVEASREMMCMLGIHRNVRTGTMTCGRKVESQVIRYADCVIDGGDYVQMEACGGRNRKNGRVERNQSLSGKNAFFLANMRQTVPLRLVRHSTLKTEWAPKTENRCKYGGTYIVIGHDTRESHGVQVLYFHLLRSPQDAFCSLFHKYKVEIDSRGGVTLPTCPVCQRDRADNECH